MERITLRFERSEQGLESAINTAHYYVCTLDYEIVKQSNALEWAWSIGDDGNEYIIELVK